MQPTASDLAVLREGPPAALEDLTTVLAAAGIPSRLTKATGCKPNG
jgi:hypothetical protein